METLLKQAHQNKNVLEYKEINDAFKDIELTPEKFEWILDYFEKQGVDVLNTSDEDSDDNYIDDDNLIRKGAISARLGERCVIPLNMRDGSLICVGKGNKDWNLSAPHGAGRMLSRSQAFKELSLDEFKQSMNGIYSETITQATLDESPMVYKSAKEIMRNIQETVNVENIIKPIFNFKATE